VKSALWMLAGCFVATFGPVTANHLIERADLAELVDAAVSTLMFTLAFGAGLALARRRARSRGAASAGSPAASAPPRVAPGAPAFLVGFAGGLLAQAVIWGVWMSFPQDQRYAVGAVVGLPFNLLVTASVGAVIEKLMFWRRGTPAAKSR
jgi:hypothetical protein